MVSRRKILSRSRDDLNLDQSFRQEEEEDIWHQKDKLFKEHIQEVLDKWNQIDDEIWAKVIVFERNRRVAKAYARAPVLTINGGDDGFDGMRIGLCGFDNPMRDQKTDELKRHIGQGVKMKMDDAGNILIRRYSRSNVYIKNTSANPKDETSVSGEILKLPNQALDVDKIVKLFDMKKFQSNINRELRQAYPDRRRLELQCLSAMAFVKSEEDMLDCPIWVLVVNIVAMDMLKSKLPPMQRPINVKSRPRLPIPDEDPYSLAGSVRNENLDSSGYGGSAASQNLGSGFDNSSNEQNVNGIARDPYYQHGNGKRNDKMNQQPPKLPPRDNSVYAQHLPTSDFDEETEHREKIFRNISNCNIRDKKKIITEDPYYCGLSARVPKFDHVKSKKVTSKNQISAVVPKRMSVAYMQHPMGYGPPPPPSALGYQYTSQQQLVVPRQHYHQQLLWHARSMESGLDHPSEFNANLYGFDRNDTRNYSRRVV